MNRERLRLVIEAVEATPDMAFDMEFWAKKTECGTVGCAVGNYILRNPDCGLRLQFEDEATIAYVSSDWPWLGSFASIARHFDIDWETGEFLFNPSEYDVASPSRAAVLDRIREFIGDPAEVFVEHKAEQHIRQTVVTR